MADVWGQPTDNSLPAFHLNPFWGCLAASQISGHHKGCSQCLQCRHCCMEFSDNHWMNTCTMACLALNQDRSMMNRETGQTIRQYPFDSHLPCLALISDSCYMCMYSGRELHAGCRHAPPGFHEACLTQLLTIVAETKQWPSFCLDPEDAKSLHKLKGQITTSDVFLPPANLRKVYINVSANLDVKVHDRYIFYFFIFLFVYVMEALSSLESDFSPHLQQQLLHACINLQAPAAPQ